MLAATALFPNPADALHRETPGVVRITSGASHRVSPSRSWGNFLAFSSEADLLGTGATGRQVYSWNLADFDCNRGTTRRGTPCAIPPRPSLIPLSDPQRHGNPDNPSINKEGTFAVFDADGAYGGGGGFQSQRRQIFQLNLETKELLQITASPSGDSTRPTINKFSNVVTFESTASVDGPAGPPGTSQIYVLVQPLFTDQRHLLRLTSGSAPSTGAMPDANGTRIVFESRADLLGDGHDTGIWQIFVADVDRAAIDFTLYQITDGNADSRRPYLTSGSANRVAFESSATNFPDTAGGGTQIYSALVNEGNFPSITQHTNQAQFGNCSHPTVDTLAKEMAFICTGDPLQNNTTGNRLFNLSVPNNVLYQLTGRGDVQGPLAHNLGVFFVVFAGSADLSATSPTFGEEDLGGVGACNYQLQVIDYYDLQPGLPTWRGATQFGQLPPDLLPPSPPDPNQFPPPISNFLGSHEFGVVPEGSQLIVTTRQGTTSTGIAAGEMFLQIAPHVAGVASITIPRDNVRLDGIPLPGGGTLCLDVPEDGSGVVDCEGGHEKGNFQVTVDHDTRNVDPACQLGCPEDAPCQGPFSGNHRQSCPSCPDGLISLCNGRTITVPGGTLSAGGLQIRLPLRLSVSDDTGIDDTACTSDDQYQFTGLATEIRLTTEGVSAAIADVDALPGASLGSLFPDVFGAPLDCDLLQENGVTPLILVGKVPLLDFPRPPTFGDAILTFRLELRSQPLHPTAENFLGDICQAGPCVSNPECDDGNICNGTETCANQTCLPGIPLCDDGDPCNGLEACDPGTGACTPGLPLLCNDNNLCTFDTCVVGEGCRFVSTCDDNNACNGIEICDPGTGACGPGTPPTCNDSNACTDDFCEPSFGCGITFNSNPCSDGSLCTTNDRCTNGFCLGTQAACNDQNACNGLESCNASTGACLAGTPLNCNDSNPCTTDSCDPLFGCLHTNNSSPCNDANACTVGDVCQGGTCVGTPSVSCSDGNPCNGLEACNPGTGACGPGAPLVCNDGNLCTDDSCTAGVGCTFVPNTVPCDDGDICTFADVCGGGVCGGILVLCEDGDQCNGIEFCDTITAACVPGLPLNCDDADPCTTDSCDVVFGCLHVQIGGCTLTRLNQTVLADMKLLVETAPADSIGGTALQRKLDRLVERARTRIRGAIGQPQHVAVRRMRSAESRIRRFLVMVDTGKEAGRISAALAENLTKHAIKALTDLKALLEPAAQA